MQAEQPSELLPCPFCGGASRFVKHSAGVRGTTGFDSWNAVACLACGGTIGACDRRFRNNADATAAWNTRAALSQPTPQDWKLVPVEPYPSQRIAGTAEWMRQIADDDEPETDKTAAVYRAMLAAAPLPVQERGE